MHPPGDPTLLTSKSVLRYLVSRRIVSEHATAAATATVLTGGVSAVVIAVRGDDVGVVVKQARAKLDVTDDWYADRARLLTEASALRLAAQLIPGAVPAVVDVDDEAYVITLALAPADAIDWRADLLQGRIAPLVASRLGHLLASWHLGSTGLRGVFDDKHGFEELRIDPFHRTVATRLPDLRDRIDELVAQLLTGHRCVVHGDFSPKNVLVGSMGVWILDWEVAHCGDPVFDVAFMLCHLMLKSIHRPNDRAAYESCARQFLTAYEVTASAGVGTFTNLQAHVGCLLLARAIGVSPAGYLTSDQRDAAEDVGRSLLCDASDVEDVWRLWP